MYDLPATARKCFPQVARKRSFAMGLNQMVNVGCSAMTFQAALPVLSWVTALSKFLSSMNGRFSAVILVLLLVLLPPPDFRFELEIDTNSSYRSVDWRPVKVSVFQITSQNPAIVAACPRLERHAG